LFRGIKRAVRRAAVADDGEVTALAADFGLANLGQVFALGDFVLVAVELFVFEESDRVVAADRALEQPLRVVGK
jgi:hypothetical protein